MSAQAPAFAVPSVATHDPMDRALAFCTRLAPEEVDANREAARLLESLGMDEAACAACMAACGAAEQSESPMLQDELGPTVAALVLGVARARRIGDLVRQDLHGVASSERGANLESLRKMLLSMAEDIRVVLILLTQRVARLRRLGNEPAARREAVARQTMDLYAPLANRLGMGALKWELEDLSFRYLEPQRYKEIARLLDEKRQGREGYIERVAAELDALLRREGIHAQVTGRPKHIYSIWRKMRRKNASFDSLYDIRAVRVLVNTVRECYAALALVQDRWPAIEGEFDDYIAHPKENGYRSLHTAVIGPEGQTLEVQIRTFDMHEDSELGVAAHWRYKESGSTRGDREFGEKLVWLRRILDWKRDLARVDGVALESTKGVFDDTIYVLTPHGRVIDLPAGATPVDFAYALHTEVGHRCRGAKVDGVIVPLNYALHNAERVEILTAKSGGPSLDWLSPQQGYAKSHRALAKIRQWFNQQRFSEDVAAGRALLDKELVRVGRAKPIEEVAASLGFGKTDEFLAALAHGEIGQRDLEHTLRGEPRDEAAPASVPVTPSAAPQATRPRSDVLVLGVDNVATLLARCCKPAPPDSIVGFVTRTRGVTVHRANCKNIIGLVDAQRERLLAADWGEVGRSAFPVDVEIDALDRAGLLRDVAEACAREHANVTANSSHARQGHARMRLTIEVRDAAHLSAVSRALREVASVERVVRR